MNPLAALKKILASATAAALLIAIPGPSCYQALAQGRVAGNTVSQVRIAQPLVGMALGTVSSMQEFRNDAASNKLSGINLGLAAPLTTAPTATPTGAVGVIVPGSIRGSNLSQPASTYEVSHENILPQAQEYPRSVDQPSQHIQALSAVRERQSILESLGRRLKSGILPQAYENSRQDSANSSTLPIEEANARHLGRTRLYSSSLRIVQRAAMPMMTVRQTAAIGVSILGGSAASVSQALGQFGKNSHELVKTAANEGVFIGWPAIWAGIGFTAVILGVRSFFSDARKGWFDPWSYPFLRRKSGEKGQSQLKKEADSMGKGAKPEIYLPKMFWGRADLDEIARTNVRLDNVSQARIDALAALTRIALRPVGVDEKTEQAYFAALTTPTRAAKALAQELKRAEDRTIVAIADKLSVSTARMEQAFPLEGRERKLDAGRLWAFVIDAVLDELKISRAAVSQWSPIIDEHAIDQENAVPRQVRRRQVEVGQFKLKLPKKKGGLELDNREYVQTSGIYAEVAPSLTGNPSAHNSIGTDPVKKYGTPEQQDDVWSKEGQQGMAAFALTEPGAGTDTSRVDTKSKLPDDLDIQIDLSEFKIAPNEWSNLSRAEKRRIAASKKEKLRLISEALKKSDKEVSLVSGEKLFITGLAEASIVIVITGHTEFRGVDLGPCAFYVKFPFKFDESAEQKVLKILQLDKDGVQVTPFMHDGFRLRVIRGTNQSHIEFKGLKVPCKQLLGNIGEGRKIPLDSLNGARFGFIGSLARGASLLARGALEWAVDRLAFDMYAPKGERGTLAHMAAPRKSVSEAYVKAAQLEALSELFAGMADENPDMGNAGISALGKARAATQHFEVAQIAEMLRGGHALFEGAPGGIERLTRNAIIPRIVEGRDEAMTQFGILASGKEVEREFKNFKSVATWKNLAWFLVWNQILLRLIPWYVPNRGIFSRADAKWIHRRTARFALRFALASQVAEMEAKWFGTPEFGARQNVLLRAGESLMDLVTLQAVLKKLAEQKGELDPDVELALRLSIPMLKRKIDEELIYVRPWGNLRDSMHENLGAGLQRVEVGQKHLRPNRVDTQIQWIRAFGKKWHEDKRDKSGDKIQ